MPLLILLFGIHPVTAVGIDLLFAAATKSAWTVVSRSDGAPVAAKAGLERISHELLRPLFPPQRGGCLLGAGLSNLETEVRPAPAQLALGLR